MSAAPGPATHSTSQHDYGSNHQHSAQTTHQFQPDSSANDGDTLLATFDRQIDEVAERRMNLAVMEELQSINLSTRSRKGYAHVLAAISRELEIPAANGDTKDPDNHAERLKNPKLLELLIECINNQNFTPIRNLEFLRPVPGLEETLDQTSKDISARLKVYVNDTRQSRWRVEDLNLEENNVAMHVEETDDCALVQDILDQLRQPRIYSKAEALDETPRAISTLNLVQTNYPEEFNKVFNVGEPRKEENLRREFMALYNILDCFWVDIREARKEDFSSSSLRSIFCNNFIHPALLYPNTAPSRPLQYQEGQSWCYSMIIEGLKHRSEHKFMPCSDWELRAKALGLPLAVCAVISDEQNRSNEWKMLIEAVAASRLGNYLLKSKEKQFAMVAVCFNYDLVARRYILKPEGKSSNAKVHIFKKDFSLKEKDDALLFLKEMLNLSSVVEDFAEDLDSDKRKKMENVQREIRDMVPLPSEGEKTEEEDKVKERDKTEEADTSIGTIHTTDEDDSENKDERGTHFHSMNIKTVLDRHGLVFGFSNPEHPNVARIYDKREVEVVEFLKFIKTGSRELEILNYLAEFETEHNHAIRPIRSWPVPGGTMVSLPPAGTWITEIKEISKHLRGLVRQLVEGIAFLHACNVAHLDIKPQNLIVPYSYGRLSIIDFDVSLHVKDPTFQYHKRVGTKGYMAPEVRTRGPYDPFKADLYSCGVVIEELWEAGDFCDEFLLSIGDRLTNSDPNRRPSMKEVLALFDAPTQTFAEK